ncbi:MAG TPA: hypothetical protein VGT41_03685 [Candidatus Babeliales bacterium]|nr:hypothetical protein [Candidatus Babeliales bacterium]
MNTQISTTLIILALATTPITAMHRLMSPIHRARLGTRILSSHSQGPRLEHPFSHSLSIYL